MKFLYSESILINILQQQIIPFAKSVLGPYHTPKPVSGTMVKRNGKKAIASCMFDLDAEGLLIVLLDPFNAEKATGYRYIRFTNMKEIKVKRGFAYDQLFLVLDNADDYQFQVIPKSSKRLPNQEEYAEHLFAILEGKQTAK